MLCCIAEDLRQSKLMLILKLDYLHSINAQLVAYFGNIECYRIFLESF